MKNSLISVIIPVYNAQETLPHALESILSQGIESMEIILVDDGSRDESLNVCRTYAQKDPRIRVVSQKNGGPGAARNAGLSLACGQYISFIDSDDTVTPGAYKRLLDAAPGADLVIAHLNIILNKKVLNRGYIAQDQVLNKEGFLDAFSKRPGSHYYSSLCNKLYALSVIKDKGIVFDQKINWGEDLLFNLQFYRHVELVSFVSMPVYNYERKLTGQTWRTMIELGPSVLIKARLYKELKALYVSSGAFNKYRYYIYRYIFNVTYSK